LRNRTVSHIFVTVRLQIFSYMRRDVFQAIADPTRREIIGLIAHQSLNLNTVADNFDISRPAISKHIKILTQCGLLTIRQKGRDRYCEANFKKLGEVSDWVEQYRSFWNNKLDALGDFLENEKAENNKVSTKHKPNEK
jgi:DNA-binding transcriptional ArsR family regulator